MLLWYTLEYLVAIYLLVDNGNHYMFIEAKYVRFKIYGIICKVLYTFINESQIRFWIVKGHELKSVLHMNLKQNIRINRMCDAINSTRHFYVLFHHNF